MTTLQQKFKQIKFNIIDERDELLKAIKSRVMYKRVFQLI